MGSKTQALKALEKYINDKLSTPEARRARFLAVMSRTRGIIKVKWDKS